VNLIGEVNYPNVTLVPSKVHFGCVTVGSQHNEEAIIVNTTPIDVYYELILDPLNSELVYIDVQQDVQGTLYIDEVILSCLPEVEDTNITNK
jgi:hypothetical protein